FTNLGCKVTRHRVDALSKIAPRSVDAFNVRLAAQFAFGADFASHARHFGSERTELIDHGVDGVFELENFASHLHGDLAREIASRHGRCDFGNVADLVGQIGSHGIDGIGEVFPDAAPASYFVLAAQFAFGAYFASHTCHFAGKRIELIDHDVDRVLQLEDLAAHIDCDLAREIAVRDSGCHFGDVTNLRCK